MNEQAILWVFGSVITILTVVIGAIFRLILSHIRECSGRWETLNTQHGALMEQSRSNGAEILRTRESLHTMRNELPEMVERSMKMFK